MAWIGIECGVAVPDLEIWAAQLRRMGGTAVAVAEFLERAARLVSGRGSAMSAQDRMLEIETRAAAAVERKTAEAKAKAIGIMSAAVAAGVDADAFMSAVGIDGWRAGTAGGDKNGGIKLRRRKRVARGGRAVYDGDGMAAVTAERGKPAVTPDETLGRDARYGTSFEGWAATELVKMGFKMRHVARGVGLDVTAAWRCVSGYNKHWKRQQLLGRVIPDPDPEWVKRLAACVDVAEGQGLRGRCVVRNGSRDCGNASAAEAAAGVNESGES